MHVSAARHHAERRAGKGTPTSGRHSSPEGSEPHKPTPRHDAPLGTYPTEHHAPQARERRPPVGTARRRRAAERTPSSGVVRLSAGTPAFSVIRTGAWYTPFAALRAAVPAPTGRTGQRSAFPCRHDIWTVGVPAPGCIYTATGQRSVFPDRRHHLDGGVPVRPAFSQQRAGSPSSLSDTPSGRSGSALHL